MALPAPSIHDSRTVRSLLYKLRRKNRKIGEYDHHEDDGANVIVILKNGRITLSHSLLTDHQSHPGRTAPDIIELAAKKFEPGE